MSYYLISELLRHGTKREQESANMKGIRIPGADKYRKDKQSNQTEVKHRRSK